MIRFSCPTCHVVLAVPDDQADRKGPCPKCGQRLLVPPTALNKTVLGKPLVMPPAAKGVGDGFAFNEPAPPHAPPQAQPIPPAGAPIPVATVGWAPAPRPQPSGLWRFISPSFLVLAIILFPLPWVDIRCSTYGPLGGPAGGKSIVTQSGLEAAYGGYTQNPEMAEQLAPYRDALDMVHGATVYPSPLMCLYPAAALLGIGFAFAVRAPAARRVLVGLCSLGAFGLLAAQTVGGFPLVGSLHRFITQAAAVRAAGVEEKDAIRAAALMAAMVEVVYTPWLWLSFAADLAAVAAVGAEWAARRGETDPESDPSASRALRRSFALCATAAAAAVFLALVAWAVFLVVALSRPPGVAGPGLAPRGDQGAPLTEDPRVAWEKLRRKHGQPSCFIAEYVAPGPAWRMHSFLRDPRRDGIGVVDLSGEFFDSNPSNFALADARQKQIEAKKAIVVVQREVDAIKANYTPGLLGNGRLESLQDALTQSRQDLADAEAAEAEAPKNPPKATLATDRAIETAIEVATATDVKVVAVVELFGGEDPKILKWFHDDGTGVKEMKSAPTPELEASLKAYLHDLQTRADQLSAADAVPSAKQAKAMFDNWFNNPFGGAPPPSEGAASLPPTGGPKIPVAAGP